LGFRNVSDRSDDAWLATALPEMLSTELAAGEKLRLIASEEVANLRISSPWSQTDTLGKETTARIGTALNSDLLVMGSYASIGKSGTRQLRLDASLQDAKTGEILAEVAEVGSTEEPFQLISRIGARLRDRMGVPAASGEERAEASAAMPSSLEAARFYARGLENLRSFDVLTARDLLQQVTTIDPKFGLGHARLAEAWQALGYSHKAEAEAKLAMDLSANLPRTDRLLIEALHYEVQNRQDKAASAYRVLFTAFPDSVEYGIKLARALGRSGQGQEGLATVSALRHLPPPASDDAGIDLIEAQLLFRQDYKKEVQLLRDASRKTSSRGQKLLYARVKSSECLILPGGSEAQSALASCEEARDLFLAAGNRNAAGYVLERMAGHYTFAGQMEEAFRYYDQALRIAQETGDRGLAGVVLTNMGMHVQDQGELERAEKMFHEARRSFVDTGDRSNEAVAAGKIGDILLARGKLNDAARTYGEAQQVAQSLDSRSGAAYVLQIAAVRKIQGRMREAQQLTEQSIALYRGLDDPGALAQAINSAGHVLLAEGDLQGARKRYEEARGLRQQIAVLPDLADSKVSFALLALAEGKPAEAESLLRDHIVEFEKDRSVGSQVMGNVTLSRALQEQGKLDDAQKIVAIAADLNRKNADPGLKLLVSIQRARVESASTAPDAAGKKQIVRGQAQLRSAIASAKELGYYESECEARLALGELELKTNPAAARLQLSTLANEARARELELVASKATQLSSYSAIASRAK
jgi:tetratricopeptide (TPR) repeat protein